jgi:hypothetical protein
MNIITSLPETTSRFFKTVFTTQLLASVFEINTLVLILVEKCEVLNVLFVWTPHAQIKCNVYITYYYEKYIFLGFC